MLAVEASPLLLSALVLFAVVACQCGTHLLMLKMPAVANSEQCKADLERRLAHPMSIATAFEPL